MKRIAIYGGSFNPPGAHHERVIRDLCDRFEQVIVVPCGPRPDKDTTNDTEPVHRAALVDMAFRRLDGIPDERVTIDLFDLEEASFTRTYELDAKYQELGELWHAIGTDLIEGAASGQCPIQKQWYRGEELWQRLKFIVYVRAGYKFDKADLPPHHMLVEGDFEGSSSETRERVFRDQPISGLVSDVCERYIRRYRLYHGSLPLRATRLALDDPRPCLIVDRNNARAVDIAERFESVAVALDDPGPPPNCFVVVGGDGMMLHAIRQHWRRRIPMIGVSAGHRGFLLNRPEDLFWDESIRREFIVQHLPLLYVECRSSSGDVRTAFAFNDAWIERASPQTAWLQVKVEGQVRIPKMVCDGALVATAAGSTAYARAMGATPMRVDTPELLLVGSNVMEPHKWKSAQLSLDADIVFYGQNVKKRPLQAFADGVAQGEVTAMRVRKSRIAAIELAFTPQRDLTAKLTEMQFPQ